MDSKRALHPKTIIIMLVVVGLLSLAAFIASRYLLLITKDSVVDHQKIPGKSQQSSRYL